MTYLKTLKATPKFQSNCYFHAKVTVLSQYERIVKLIKHKLNDEATEKFKESCFGKLVYEDPNLQLCSQLVHQIMLREANCGSSEELWFNICGTTTRFGPQEFCLVTGLGWGDLDKQFAEIISKEDQPRLLKIVTTDGRLTQAALLDFFKS